MEEIYEGIPDTLAKRDVYFLEAFQNMFQYTVSLKDAEGGKLAKPVEFLMSKACYLQQTDRQAWFVKEEFKQHYFQRFFGEMLRTGFLCHYEYTGTESIISMMECIFTSVYSVYHAIYLGAGQRLSVAEKSQVVDISTQFVFQRMLLFSNIHNFRDVDFNGIMLSEIKFSSHIFRHASFKGSLMLGCIFDNCDLRGADFRGASLKRADFRGAKIDKETLFSEETEFKDTIISPEQTEYFKPWLGGKIVYSQESESIRTSK